MFTRLGMGICMSHQVPTPNYMVVYDFATRDFVKYPPQPNEIKKWRDDLVRVLL
jgi:hypothetical protein